MYRPLFRSCFYFSSAVVAPNHVKHSLEEKEETGWDRIVKIFEVNEFNELSKELSNIYNTTLMTAFVGAFYGGFIHSRDAYLKFIESNEATKYTDHFEAKKKLQDYVTINFLKGAFKWSWRLALFGGMYVSFVSFSSAYRNSNGLLDFTLAGLVSGSLYRVHYGLKGVIVGGTLGCMIGLMAGSFSLLLFKLSGNQYDDIANFQKELHYSRVRHLKEAIEKAHLEENEMNMLHEHDKKINVS